MKMRLKMKLRKKGIARYNEWLDLSISKRSDEAKMLIKKHKPMPPKMALKRHNQHNKNEYPSEKWFLKCIENQGFYEPHRNFPVANGRFLGDFVFFKHNLIVEIDGHSHKEQKQMEHDASRDKLLALFGFKVVRINHKDDAAVFSFLKEWADKLQKPIQAENVKPTKTERRIEKPRINKRKEIKRMFREKRQREQDRLNRKQMVRELVNKARIFGSDKWLERRLRENGITLKEAKELYF